MESAAKTGGTEHIVGAYDDELKKLTSLILRMGGLAESQLAAALQAVARRDTVLAEEVIETDQQLDDLESAVNTLTTRLLALRQPVAVDLRVIVSSLRISTDLERIGDLAKNSAKRAMTLSQAAPVDAAQSIPRLGAMVQRMLQDVLDAFTKRDVDRAIEVWQRDEEVDRLYNSLFREYLTYMMEDPRNITPCTHLLFIAKNLERIGDHATNLAEAVYFLINGARLREIRRKSDDTAAAVATGANG
ncbi:MAG: phosphate signaling complex protein PhoU [Alphaproteobacteria bacterium]|nr:phosphate signaling complex protein PhoU [Alphaproteobacteria bacterium]